MGLSELLQWWNLIFELPFVGSAIYVLLLGVGAVGHDVDGAADADPSGHLAHGAEHAPDVHGGGTDHDVHGGIAGALDFLGIGRVPLSIVLPSFWLIWSFVGFAANALLGDLIEAQPAYVLISVAVAAASAIVVTRAVSRAVLTIMPRTQSYGVATEDLVGSVGVAGYPGVSMRFGEARVYDEHGNQHIVSCRLRSDAATIKTGDTLLLVEYDSASRLFLVEPYDDSVESG